MDGDLDEASISPGSQRPKRAFRAALKASPSRPDVKSARGDEHDDDFDVGSSQTGPCADDALFARCGQTFK